MMLPDPCHMGTKLCSSDIFVALSTQYDVKTMQIRHALDDNARLKGSRSGGDGVRLSAGVRVGYDRRMSTVNTFGTRTALAAGGRTSQIYSLPALEAAGYPEIARL